MSKIGRMMAMGMLGGGASIDWSFDQGSLASVAVTDFATATPTIRLNPFLDVVSSGNKTQWFAVRLNGYAGKTPTFLLAKATLWTAYTDAMWTGVWAIAADTDTWYQFDNVSVGDTDISMSMDTPFPAGTIYVALQPLYPFSRTQKMVAQWAGNALVGETASTTNKIISLSTALAADGMGKAPANLPYYALKVSNATANTKNNAIISARQHACEPQGGYALEGAMSWLLTTSVEQKSLLDWCNIICYPSLYPQNTLAGHSRMLWTDYSKDINSMWSTTGDSENVDVFKTAMAADSGDAIEAGVDFHGYVSDTNGTTGIVTDTAAAAFVAFKAEMVKLDAAYGETETVDANGIRYWWENTLGASLALTQEQLMGKSRTIANWKTFGENSMKALSAIQAAGQFTNGPEVGSRDFNGTTDRIDWTSPWTPSGAMTLSFWLAADRNNAQQGLFCIGKAGDGYDGLYLWLSSAATAGKISFIAEGGTDMAVGTIGNVVPADGTWHNYIVTWNGVVNPATGCHIYKDGLEAEYAAQTAGATPNAYSGKWSLGGFLAIDNYNIDGRMAQVAVWKSVLSAGNIANLAKGHSPSLITPAPAFYFKGNTDDLHEVIGNVEGTADGTTEVTGAGNGPAIYY